MTPPAEVLDDIIGSLDPEDIPVNYILMAKVVDLKGNEMILRGGDLDRFLKNPFSVSEVRVILDVGSIRSRIIQITQQVFSTVQEITKA